MNAQSAHAIETPKGLTQSDYEQVRAVGLAWVEEARQAYREACAAHTQGKLDEAELLRLKAAVDEAEMRLGVLDNSVQEQRRVSAEQAKEHDAEARQRSVEAIEADWGDVEESFAALIEGISALGPKVSTILQALENIVGEAAAHRGAFGSHRSYGELVGDLRDIDFRMAGLVQQSLYDAGLSIFVLGIGKMTSEVGDADPASALVIKRRTVSSLLGQLSRPREG
jgi:hypothetical protein